jgi:membrane associated rhomboid family serine protease
VVSVSSGWVILLFLCFDIWGAVSGAGRVAYVAHLGGFFAGFLLASLLSNFGAVEAQEGERSLWDVLVGTRPRR